jgi:L-alanine-DL-glutamate epimerase-like enolase superfamily enzyme
MMKITSVEATPLARPLNENLRWGAMEVSVKGGILVRVTTDEGLVGYGEAGFSAQYFSTVGPIINQQLAPLLVGEDPLDAGRLWQRMFDATHMWGRRGVETYAVSGVDIALWDLLGKVAGLPVYQLLGATKSDVRAYFAPSLKRTEEVVNEARQAKDDGYTAIKLRTDADVRAGIDLVTRVRDAVGPDFDIAVDGNMAYDRRTALAVAREFEQLGVAWFEEPILARSLSQYVDEHCWLADRVSLQLSGGESLFSRFEFIELMTRRPFDIVQPDCTSVGGISEAKRVADMASAWNLTCVPHIACSSGIGIGLAAGLHLILACANAPLVEFDPYGGPAWEGMLVQPPQTRDGRLTPSDAPGLGLELSEDAFERFGMQPPAPAAAAAA